MSRFDTPGRLEQEGSVHPFIKRSALIMIGAAALLSQDVQPAAADESYQGCIVGVQEKALTVKISSGETLSFDTDGFLTRMATGWPATNATYSG
jgi:hypothetical protein